MKRWTKMPPASRVGMRSTQSTPEAGQYRTEKLGEFSEKTQKTFPCDRGND